MHVPYKTAQHTKKYKYNTIQYNIRTVHPGTVVVHAGDAATADAAVVRPVGLVGPAGRADGVITAIGGCCRCCRCCNRRRHRLDGDAAGIGQRRLGVRRQRQARQCAVRGGAPCAERHRVAVRQQQHRHHAVPKQHPDRDGHAATDGIVRHQPHGIAGAGAKRAARQRRRRLSLLLLSQLEHCIVGRVVVVVIIIVIVTATDGADAAVVVGGGSCRHGRLLVVDAASRRRGNNIAAALILVVVFANKDRGDVVRFLTWFSWLVFVSVVAATPPQRLQRRTGLLQLPRQRTADAASQEGTQQSGRGALSATRLLFAAAVVVVVFLRIGSQKQFDVFVVVLRQLRMIFAVVMEDRCCSSAPLSPPGHAGR